MTLAALTVELARALGDGGASTLDSPVDLFSLSRIYETAGSRAQSVATCQRALSGGLPEEIEARALYQLATQYKRERRHELATETWLELSRRTSDLALEAFKELAIHYEHHRRDLEGALEFTLAALERLNGTALESSVAGQAPDAVLPYGSSLRYSLRNPMLPHAARFTRRLERLRHKLARIQPVIHLPLG